MDQTGADTIGARLFPAFVDHADRTMQILRGERWTFREAARAILGVAQALRRLGVAPGDRVGLIAENSPRWFHAFAGILAAGGVAVTRGEETSQPDLEYILRHAEARIVFAGSAKVAARLPAGLTVIPMEGEGFPAPAGEDGAELVAAACARRPDDIAVLLYTSGTTGRPKGVVLEQRNIAHNMRVLPPLVDIRPGDLWVSLLPPWHTFEQTVELCAFGIGCTTVYTDKRRLRDDLREHRPHFFASVPRIWESVREGALAAVEKRGPLVRALFRACYASSRMRRRGNPLGWPLDLLGRRLFYRKIAAATGGRLKAAISGGGYLPPHVDEFFAIVGVCLLIGYGLTETAPVVSIRRPANNVLGTIGRPVDETEVKVGPSGTFLVRGPQVMRGYYRDEELTRAVLSPDGWFDTGDLGSLTPEGDLVFIGRSKETIVLSGGENVEPEPIENALLESRLLRQVMIVGQDRKGLGALLVPREDQADDPELAGKLRAWLRARTGTAAGRPAHEGVTRFALVQEPFSPENGLQTQTLKLRRNQIAERYAREIDLMYG
ncbi:MAG: AMP-dependent synthetase/ligase [Planctomycetaceae bacterium]